MKVAIYTLGCKVNQSESASIGGLLKEKGHEIVPILRDDNPDVCIVNTCTVTAKSDYQSRQLIRRAVRSGAQVIATGCYAQLKPEELSKIKGLGFVIGNSQKDKLHEYITKLPLRNAKTEGVLPSALSINSPESPFLDSYYSKRARAFLKIQDGCNFSCSYCTIPMARGKSRSLSPEDVLNAVERFNVDRYREIVLTGIHIGSYGLELKPKSSLLKIVERITNMYPQIRIRLSSIEPQEFKKDFLLLIKKGGICPHLHIPLQSGSDNILKEMNRGYSTSFFKNLINEIILTCPEISIGTDVIVGFPGESEKDYQETVKLLEELPLSYIHVFPYSKRQKTSAASLSGQVSNDLKRKRVSKILEIAKKKKNDYITRQLGEKLNVIVEHEDATNGFYRAISDNYIRLLVKADKLNLPDGSQVLGQRMHVEATCFSDGELICKPV